VRHRPGRAAFLVALELAAIEHDLLAVELPLTAAEGHARGPGIGPDAGESARGRLEPEEALPRRPGLVLPEGEIGLEEPAVVDHRLGAFPLLVERCVARPGVEGLLDVPAPHELLEELLTFPGSRARLKARLRILLVGVPFVLRAQVRPRKPAEQQE